MAREDRYMRIRVPDDMKEWLKEQARENLRSQNAEIVLAVREKMRRTKNAAPAGGEASGGDVVGA